MAERVWKQWLHRALRCQLEPIRRVARMIRDCWYGVVNAAASDVTRGQFSWPKGVNFAWPFDSGEGEVRVNRGLVVIVRI
jgi:hypothetical protein